MLGAVVGAVVGIGVQAAIDAYNGELSGVGAYAGAAAGGAIAGATAGLAPALGLGVYGTAALAGATGNVAAGVTEDAINGKAPTASGVIGDAAVGGAFGLAGGVVGSRLSNGLDRLSNQAKGKLGEKLTIVNEALKGNKRVGTVTVYTGAKTRTGLDQRAIFDHRMVNRLTQREKICESKCGFHAGPTLNQTAAMKTGVKVQIDKSDPDSLGGTASGALFGGVAAGANDNP